MKKIYSFILASVFGAGLVAQPAGWSYIQHSTVTNNLATQVLNYQLQLTINTQTPIANGQMNANGDDIRFGKDCAGNLPLNYWIESGINTTTTLIWVKIDTLPASGTIDLYMYYGNSSATAASAIPGVFIGPHSSTDSVASGGAGGVAGSQRGFRFSPNETVLMSHAGKREPNGTTRYVTLFDFATQAIITQQQVGGAAAQYNYNPLPSPVWLTAGTQYVLELFQGTGDGYYFGTSSQIGQHLTYLDMRYCNSCTQNTFPTNTLTNYHYGYPDMWYWTKQTIAAAPTVAVGTPAVLTTTNSGPATTCLNDSASASVTASGGISPYTYNWLPASGVANPNSATTMISTSVTTTYTCTIFDACGNGILDSITITVNNLPAVVAGVSNDSVCTGTSFTPSGSGASTYVWSGGLIDGAPFPPAATDTYTVTGTDGNGCVNTATVTVEVLALPVVVATATSDTICEGYTTILTGTGANSYTWDNSVIDGDTISPSATTTYVVIGTDLYGCEDADTIEIVVNLNPAVSISAPTTACDIDAAFTLAGTPAGGAFSGPGVTGNSFDPATAGVGTHVLTYTFTDSLGCTGVDTISVVVDLCLGLTNTDHNNGVHVFPNPFENTFTIQLDRTGTANVRILNSLGQVMLDQEMNEGRNEISTEHFAAGIYFLEVETVNGKETIKIIKNN